MTTSLIIPSACLLDDSMQGKKTEVYDWHKLIVLLKQYMVASSSPAYETDRQKDRRTTDTHTHSLPSPPSIKQFKRCQHASYQLIPHFKNSLTSLDFLILKNIC